MYYSRCGLGFDSPASYLETNACILYFRHGKMLPELSSEDRGYLVELLLDIEPREDRSLVRPEMIQSYRG